MSNPSVQNTSSSFAFGVSLADKTTNLGKVNPGESSKSQGVCIAVKVECMNIENRKKALVGTMWVLGDALVHDPVVALERTAASARPGWPLAGP